MPGIGRVHAVLMRSDKGAWRLYDIFSKGGVWVNGVKVGANGVEVRSGDVLNLAGTVMRFLPVNTEQREALEQHRTRAGQSVSPAVTLIELTLLQAFLLTEHLFSAEPEYVRDIALAFAGLMCIQWLCYYAMRFIGRSGFEVETLAFYLSSLGMSVAASSTPEDMYKQLLLTAAGVVLFLIDGWWLRNLRRTSLARIPVAVFALALLGLNVVTSDAVFGARNWLEFGGYSFQPSEFVKALYIYVGASTLDRLYRTRNLYTFIGFSAVCVVALALIGDFGTALIFFVSFLVISFMRSGSIATVLLAVSGAGLAGFLAVSVKPYIAQRFAAWGARVGGYLRQGLSADARHVRRRLGRALRQGRGKRLAGEYFRGEHGHGVCPHLRGAGADHRDMHGARGADAGVLRGALGAARPLGVLLYRRVRGDEHASGAAGAERVRLAGHSAVHGCDVPVRVARRLVASCVLDDDGIC